jgi:sulfate/thiosulfate transport system ATP-binding protein
MSIEAQHITKSFGSFKALDDVSIHVASGELVALLGPSGSGKTTLLRIIAGLEMPDEASGVVRFHQEDMTHRAVGARRVGFVFQHYALFRHMTVFQNVAFGLKVRPRRERPSRAEIRERVMNLLRLVQIEALAHRYPSQLSGGQRQRVALARALAVEPRVLLLDEPFGALDAKVRRELRRWLRKLHDEMGITSVFVTHDQEEALEVADRIAVMNKGRIEQIGTPEEVYEHPANPFVYNFLGNVNLFHGRVSAGRLRVGTAEFAAGAGEGPAESGTGATAAEFEAREAAADGAFDAVAFVRPHDVEVAREADGGDAILAHVDHISFAGPFVHVQLTRRDNGQPVEAAVPRERYRALGLKAKEDVYVRFRNARVFAEQFAEDYSI